jgi:hypothetical protein
MMFFIEDLKLSEKYENIQNENIFLFDELLELEKINGSLSILRQYYYNKKDDQFWKVEIDIIQNKCIDIDCKKIQPTTKMKEEKEKKLMENKIKEF